MKKVVIAVSIITCLTLCSCATSIPSTSALFPTADSITPTSVEPTKSDVTISEQSICEDDDFIQSIYSIINKQSIPIGEEFSVSDSNSSSINGIQTYTVQSVGLYTNLYQAGFDLNLLDDISEKMFPYPGSPPVADMLDQKTGDILDGNSILRVDLSITNLDAWNELSEQEYGDKYLFDIRELYLADFSYIDNNYLLCSSPALFSLLNMYEDRFLYRLPEGETITVSLGYWVNCSTMDTKELYLCNRSGIWIPDEISDSSFIRLNG